MNVEGRRVLVVGAGIAGLATARALTRAGASVRVVERSSAPAASGAGLYLPGNAARALGRLGLEAEVTERAHRIEQQRFSDHRGKLLFELPVEAMWHDVGPCLALPRTDLLDALLAAAVEVPIAWATSPVSLVPEPDGVAVGLDDGSTDRVDLVVGADGLRSSVRRLVFGEVLPRPVGQHARRFVLGPTAGDEDLDGTWSVMLGRGTSFLTVPLGRGSVYCYCDGPPGSERVPLAELLADYAEPVPRLLDRLTLSSGLDEVQHGPIEEVTLTSWCRGAVVLIGDAAHATSPNMAEGAAMALEDAVVLAESLGSATDVAAGIAAFERRRRPRTDWVREQTHRRDRARSLPPMVRNRVLTRFGRGILQGNYAPLREPA